ncbi:FG-GAP-like repeat-containing protein, partial [Pedococcus sp.]|uniref:FG-GAP-like repeat-containing protein n=1 Tax=Pedococcus sp. TaxID=2860345 RepID=UPI002E0F635D|nr:FG-GAP-like repeat-containing protein [Pedococcus sp.]
MNLKATMTLKATLSALVAAATVTLAMGSLPAQSLPAQGAPAAVNPTAASDWSGDGRADIVAPTADGRLWMYRGDGAGGFAGAPTQVGQGWNGLDQIRMVGNWDGTGGTDIIARNPSTGALMLYPGNGAGGFAPSRTIGNGWQAFSHIFSPGDWDGDGHPDLLATVKSDGTLRLYRGNGAGGFLGMSVIGSGWGPMDSFMPTGDFDGDGAPDFLARNTATGQLDLYRSNGTGGFAATRVVGTNWGGFTALLGAGDWSGDGHSDVLARLSDGTLRMYRGDGAGGWISPYPVIGTGWNSIRFPDQPASDGPASCTPTWTSSASDGSFSTGDYVVNNNMWSGDAGPQTISACSWHQWSVTSNQPGTGSDDSVKTYPDTQKHVSYPLSSFTSLPSSFDVTTPAGGGTVPANGKQWNAAYD